MAASLTPTATTSLDEVQQKHEWLTCSESALYFIYHYVSIYDAQVRDWVPFKLWPAQARVLKLMVLFRLLALLKARQIGMTWLALAFALWLMLFFPAATILLFSKRDDEAVDLLDFRLKGMYARLPDWMKTRAVLVDNEHEWVLSNGSRAMAFPSNAGDSYTATLVIGDEFDLVQDQDRLMGSIKPTIDNGGRMILLSRPDKSRPQTRFKKIYQAGKLKQSGWRAVFLPWFAHPDRSLDWYERQKADIQSSTGSLDELYEQYPATDTEALAARTLDKRIPPLWLEQCYAPLIPLWVVGESAEVPENVPAIPGLIIYKLPEPGKRYVIGVDPAEGLPTSNDSALTVGEVDTGEEVASLAGKFEPKVTFPRHIDALGMFYNRAAVMVERNNHGHAVIGYLQNQSRLRLLDGFDRKTGWHTTPQGKVRLYDDGASVFMHGGTILHRFETRLQIASIEKSTLSAPEGEMDDLSDSYMLMLEAAATPKGVGFA